MAYFLIALCLLAAWADASAPAIATGYSYKVETVPHYQPPAVITKQVAPAAAVIPSYSKQISAVEYRPTTVVKEIPAVQYQPATVVKEIPAVQYRPTTVVKEVPTVQYRPTTVVKEVPAVQYRPTTLVKEVPAVQYRPTVVKEVPTIQYRPTVVKEVPTIQYRPKVVKEVPTIQYRPAIIPQYEAPVYKQIPQYVPKVRTYATPKGYSFAAYNENRYYYPSGYGQAHYVQAYKPTVLSTLTGVRIPSVYAYPEPVASTVVKTKSTY